MSPCKNEEIKKSLLSGISLIFNELLAQNLLLDKLLQRLVDYGNFTLAEVRLIGADKNRISLASHISRVPGMKPFYDASKRLKSFAKGESLPGAAKKRKKTNTLGHISLSPSALRLRKKYTDHRV